MRKVVAAILCMTVFAAGGARARPVAGASGADVAKLPAIHSDPFDRMLVTQARSDGLFLLSHDSKVIAYGESVARV